MNIQKLEEIIAELKDCQDYFQGKVHSPKLQQIAKEGAIKEVTAYKNTLLSVLSENGLNITSND
jgi:hypothetical protein